MPRLWRRIPLGAVAVAAEAAGYVFLLILRGDCDRGLFARGQFLLAVLAGVTAFVALALSLAHARWLAGAVWAGFGLLGAFALAVMVFPPMFPPNETVAIGDLRALASAEGGYQSANGGYYDTLRCVAEPWHCIRGHPVGDRFDLIDGRIDDLPYLALKRGYDRRFHPGPPAPAAEIRDKNLSPSSLTAWAYTAVPRRRGCDGDRAFCMDSTAVMRMTTDGSSPPVVEGRCEGPGWQVLR
jgi:multidrug transporter EmrE-like cation transporter